MIGISLSVIHLIVFRISASVRSKAFGMAAQSEGASSHLVPLLIVKP